MARNLDNDDADELPFEENFIEQAEYIDPQRFSQLSTQHPDEVGILRKLKGGGAKLLIGPRGCGKSTLMLKAFHEILSDDHILVLPIYVNFKLALKVEPLYSKNANAPFWFRGWLTLRVFDALHDILEQSSDLRAPSGLPARPDIMRLLSLIESGMTSDSEVEKYGVHLLQTIIDSCLQDNNLQRCIILMDDAAHAFSEKQQEDFFDFFRSIKSKTIAPKAAIYPGITSHSPSFQVGHDAEQVDAWVRPIGEQYENFMLEMARKRFEGTQINIVESNADSILFMAYASFGIPRAFLGMLRTIYNNPTSFIGSDRRLLKTKLLAISRSGRDMSNSVYDALESRLPPMSSYIRNGKLIYGVILENIKSYNAGRSIENQALQFGIRKPVDPELEKIFDFFQYSGLASYSGDVSRGENGVFSVYDIHLGELISGNALVGKRTKSIELFLASIRSPKHQAWPRTYSEKILEAAGLTKASFYLSLPQCQVCGTERSSPDARFCFNCGAQLKASSAYEELSGQDISSLPISSAMKRRIREHSQLRKIRDILVDKSREKLMDIPYIKKARATKIVGAAEEFVS